MTDDDQLRRLLSDAVSDVEPRDRLAEIRASVHPDPQVVPMSRPRPWLYALSGAVASAAVIGVIAYTTNALSGPDGDGTGLGGGRGDRQPVAPRRRARRRRPTRPRPPSPSTSSSTTAVTTGAKAYAVYYVGAERRRQAGPLPRVAPRARPPDRRPGGQRRRRPDRGGRRRDGDAPARPRLPHALARPGDARPRGVRRVRRGRHAADRARRHRDRGPTRRHDRRGGAGGRPAARLHRPGRRSGSGCRSPSRSGARPAGAHPTLLGVDISRPVGNAPVLTTLSLRQHLLARRGTRRSPGR